MSSEMFLQGTDPSSFWRITFSISRPVAMSPQSGGNTPKRPQKQGGGDFSGAPRKAGRAGPAFTPRRRALLFLLVTQPFPHE